MPAYIHRILEVCLIAWLLLLLLGTLRTRSWRRFFAEAGAIFLVVLLLRWFADFPDPANRRSFGPDLSPAIVVLMLLSIGAGMAARYFFSLRRAFSWIALLRPFCVSPIVLLPLLGTVHGIVTLEPLQVISFALLSFQNGFFWRLVFERVQANV